MLRSNHRVSTRTEYHSADTFVVVFKCSGEATSTACLNSSRDDLARNVRSPLRTHEHAEKILITYALACAALSIEPNGSGAAADQGGQRTLTVRLSKNVAAPENYWAEK
jgi:hypothetical protein